jgi:hypothetical protein
MGGRFTLSLILGYGFLFLLYPFQVFQLPFLKKRKEKVGEGEDMYAENWQNFVRSFWNFC